MKFTSEEIERIREQAANGSLVARATIFAMLDEIERLQRELHDEKVHGNLSRADLQNTKRERDEEKTRASRFSDLLERTADALKGPPDELTLHSWHDLPEVAARLRSERAKLVAFVRDVGDFKITFTAIEARALLREVGE